MDATQAPHKSTGIILAIVEIAADEDYCEDHQHYTPVDFEQLSSDLNQFIGNNGCPDQVCFWGKSTYMKGHEFLSFPDLVRKFFNGFNESNRFNRSTQLLEKDEWHKLPLKVPKPEKKFVIARNSSKGGCSGLRAYSDSPIPRRTTSSSFISPRTPRTPQKSPRTPRKQQHNGSPCGSPRYSPQNPKAN